MEIAMSKQRILIIDDEVSIIRGIKLLLEDKYDVMTASSGKEGLDLITQEKGNFDLILCDITMPDINGARLFLSIAGKHKHLEDRFMFMTGGPYGGFLDEFGISKEIPYLTKPFNSKDLHHSIEEFFLLRKL